MVAGRPRHVRQAPTRKNSEIYVRWGIKTQGNEELRQQYIR